MQEGTMIYDPLGNSILLTRALFDCPEAKGHEVYDDATVVITKPALVILVKDKDLRHYYFRSVGWNKSVIIIASFNGDHFFTESCIVDPSQSFMTELFEKGKQLI